MSQFSTRAMATLLAMSVVAAACSGSSSPSDDATTNDGAVGAGGGQVDAGLVDRLGLPQCPVGAHLNVDGPVEIDLWHPYAADTADSFEDIAAAFNASQDQIIVNVQARGDYTELLSAYRESINFGDLPAIAITDGRALRDMVDSGTVLPAQSCVEVDGFDLSGIDELVRGFYSIDGALYPAAVTVSTPVLYYNRTSFEDAGLDPDDPPGTLVELRDAARAIKDAQVADTPLSLILHGWFIDTWLTGAGVPIVNADNGRSGAATEANMLADEALEIYELLAEMDEAGLILPFSNTPGQFQHYFAALDPSKVAMVIETSTASTTIADVLGGTGNLAELVDQAGVGEEIIGASELNLDFDVAPMPGLNEPGKVFVSGGAFYMTNSGTAAEKAAAWEFIKYLNAPEQQKIVHLEGSWLPVSDDVVADPDVAQVWATDAAGGWLQTSHEQLRAIDPDFPGPTVGPFTEQRDIIQRSLDDLILGDGDPAELLARVQEELNQALKAYNESNF